MSAGRCVGQAADVWSGELVAVEVDGRPIVLLRSGDRVCAYIDRCAHLGVKISEGRLDAGVITCRAHGWQYDATSGCGVNPRDAALRSLPIEEREGRLYVDLSGVDGE